MDRQKFFLLLFLALFQKLYGGDLRITGGELGLYLRPEFNRTFYYSGDFSVLGAVELNGRYTHTGGFALGTTGRELDIKLFTNGEILLPGGRLLYFKLAYMYHGLPGYETQAHTVLPVLSFRGRRAGISIGAGLRSTGFFDGPPVFESMLSFSGYVNFIAAENLRLGLRCANFNDYSTGNMGSYSLGLYSAVRLGRRWTLINEIELLQSGSVALSSNFFGISYRGGVRFTW